MFALLRFWATLGGAPIRFPDSDSYYQLNFLGHDLRLWTVPLIYKPLFSDGARVVVQILLGIVCWSALALAVARSLKTALVARLGAVLILLIGLCVQVVAWDQIILSESIALSLTALLIASLLRLRLRRSTGSLIGFVVVLTLWIFTRQLQAAVYIPIAVVGIIWILARGWRRRSSVLLACSLAVLAVWAGYVATQAKPIIATNAYGLLVLRILKTSDGREFFASRGMPGIAILNKEAATDWAYGDHHAFSITDSDWSEWIDHHWKRTYGRWLLGRPLDDLRVPLSHLPTYLAGDPDYGSPRGTLPSPIQNVLWETNPSDSGSADIPLWLGLVLALEIIALRSGRPGTLDALGVGLFLCAVLWFLVAYHTTIGENGRVLIPVAASIRIAIVILVLSSLDRILLHRRTPP